MKALRVLAAILAMFIISCGQTDKKTEDTPSGTADSSAPTAPTSLVANAVSTSEIELNWYAASDNVGVDGYKVFRKEGTSGASVEIGKTALTTYKSTTLNPGTQYCYQVYAYDKAGNTSTGSGEDCDTTKASSTGQDVTPPSAPTNLIANSVSSSQIDLSWTASTDDIAVTGYNVYNGTVLLMSVNATSASSTGLTAATAYCFTVSANDAAGNESFTSAQACTTTLSSGGANSAPTAYAGINQDVATGSLVNLDGMGSDADGDALTYSWSFVSIPSGSAAALSSTTTVTPTFTADLDGIYVIKLVVSDGTDSAEDAVTITAATATVGGGPYVLIPTGCFNMGDAFSEGGTDELPVHNVCITGFYMDEHEVTNAEYKACVDAGGCTSPSNTGSYTRASYYGNATYDNFPAIYVDWNKAVAYCTWTGKRLPTEAEWEYAARGGLSGKRYPLGDTITGGNANYYNSGDIWDNDTSPVENYAANGYGLYDMAGNVWEWVNDWHQSGYYSISPTSDPQGPVSGSYRVLRGGCWDAYTSYLRVANRDLTDPTSGFNSLGFRCARD